MHFRTKKRSSWAGFTLVEVVLAVGVVAFAFVTTMSLLPIGLNVSRQAMDMTAVSHIYQSLSAHTQQTDFSRLNTLAGEEYYFDAEGKATSPESSLYKAQFRVQPSTSLPGAQATGRLATVSIFVVSTRGKVPGAADALTDPTAEQHNLLIPDNGI